METVHSEKDIETFICKCQYETFTQHDLDIHLKSCTISNKVTCEICFKTLANKRSLKTHLTIHKETLGFIKKWALKCKTYRDGMCVIS